VLTFTTPLPVGETLQYEICIPNQFMKQSILDMLAAVDVISEQPSWIEVRRKVQKAVDSCPTSVTLEQALLQVNNKNFLSGQARGSQ